MDEQNTSIVHKKVLKEWMPEIAVVSHKADGGAA